MGTLSFFSPASRPILHIDLETYSDVDIAECGVYKYAESPSFEILLFGYAYEDGPVKVVDLTTGEKLPPVVVKDLSSPEVLKAAHNAAFEMVCLRAAGYKIEPSQWLDTAAYARYCGLPASLEKAVLALGAKQDKHKDSRGKALIAKFCKPCKPTKSNGGQERCRPRDYPEDWQVFKEYNAQDIVAEREVWNRLKWYPITESERRIWEIDTEIMDRGVLIDTALAKQAVVIGNEVKSQAEEELIRLTGLSNPNSIAQLKGWLADRRLYVESLDKKAVKELIQTVPDDLKKVLKLRQTLGKTSTTKYKKMLDCACKDSRAHGLLQYYGASRTGRWAGRLVQVQNLPQNHLADLDMARGLVAEGDLDTLKMLYASVPDTLSQLIRTAFIAPEGHTLLVADYSAIEARVVAWLSGESWRLDTFAKGEDIYCKSASAMFGVPVVKHGENGHLRQKGKVAELACGYGGGIGALKAMGAEGMGLSEAEMAEIVQKWREASPNTCQLWRTGEQAVRDVIRGKRKRAPYAQGAEVLMHGKDLLIKLPSGRLLVYCNARLEKWPDGREHILYQGTAQSSGQWIELETYGGKLLENLTQAVARDCLAVAIERLKEKAYKIVMHVHDEIIAEAPEGSRWEDMAEIMSRPIEWAPGLVLTADGYDTKYYRKD